MCTLHYKDRKLK